MKINQIIINETSAGATGSGSVATVSSPLGKTQSRNASIYGDKKVGSLLKGKKTSKPYANSLAEGKKVDEAKLDEEDKIIAVGKGNKLKPGLLNKPENSLNPTDAVKIDVPLLIRLLEYAREDAGSDLDLHDLAEKLVDRGRRGRTLSMKDYEFVVDEASPGGVIAGGGVGESQSNPTDFLKPGKWIKFGMWNKPEQHRIGRIMSIQDGIVTAVIDGGPESGKMVKLHLGNKSLSIKPAQEPNQGLAGVRNEGVAEGSATIWEVSYDYGPHMTKTVKVKASSEQEAAAKVEKAAEKKGLSIMINSVTPVEQGVAEAGEVSQLHKAWDKALKTKPVSPQQQQRNKERWAKRQAEREQGVAEGQLDEKAVSKAQQKFMGMAHAIQKGKKIPGASKELKDVAKGMSKKAGHDFASTKHKGLPEKVKKKD